MRYGGRYELKARIGEGAMAEVWSAHDPSIDRVLAVDLLKPEFLSMELLDGVPLDEALEAEGKLPDERVLAIAAQLAGALSYAHLSGVNAPRRATRAGPRWWRCWCTRSTPPACGRATAAPISFAREASPASRPTTAWCRSWWTPAPWPRRSARAIAEAADALMEAALATGAPDNVSLVLVAPRG